MTATITTPEATLRSGRGPARSRTHRAAPVTPRTYARRRAFVGGVSAVIVALALVAGYDAFAGSSGAPASAAVSRPAGAGSVVARSGDTLWAIAERHRGDVGVRRYVDALVELNGGPAIQAGQRVLLP